MKIKKLNLISYGKFKNKQITFTDGVNIVYGKNEAGKSTVMSFIKGMLYGFSGRGTSPATNERKKYTPWDGSAVSGEIIVKTKDGKEIIVTRSCGKTQSTDKMQAIDAVSGTEVEFTAQKEIGIGEKAFTKTLYIGQLASKIEGEEDEITTRLINLAQSGDEKNNYSKADSILAEEIKKYKARGNKGLIDDTVLKISRLRQELEDSQSHQNTLFEKIERKKFLETEIDKLGNELKELKEKEVLAYNQEVLIKKVEAEKNYSKLLKEQAEIQEQINSLKQELIKYSAFEEKPDPVIFEQIEEGEILQKEQANLQSKAKIYTVLAVCTFFTIILPIIFIRLSKKIKESINGINIKIEKYAKKQKELSKYGSANIQGYIEKQAQYKSICEKKALLCELLSKNEERIKNEKIKLMQAEEKLSVQGNGKMNLAPVNISEVHFEEKEKEELLRAYIKEEAEISGIIKSAMNSVRESSDIAAEIENEQANLQEYEKKYSALIKARETLSKAYEQVSRNFAPRLNKRASEILEKITSNSFDIIADKSYNIMVHSEGVHELAYFSGGACDQVYLALRIALAEMTAKEDAPIFLDDTFIQYDDERTKKALDFMAGMNRQIIIFSCKNIQMENANLIEL